MSENKISKIRVKGIDYEVKDKRQSGVNNITSLTSIPNTKEQVIAKLAGPTDFSLSAMEPGDSIEITCIPSTNFTQNIAGDNIIKSFDYEDVKLTVNKPVKLHAECYESGKIFVDMNGGEEPTYYILVSLDSRGGAKNTYVRKFTDPSGSSTENVLIPANSINYKIDGLKYGFDFFYSDSTETFGGANVANIDLSNFDTSSVTNMNYMFIGCHYIPLLDLSNFDTSKVTSMNYMFGRCTELTSLDLSNFDTSKVTSMESMFNDCSSLTSLDLSNFDTSKVTSMENMFSNCSSLTYIKCKQAFKDWCLTNQDTIDLPEAMRSSGSGKWEIVS